MNPEPFKKLNMKPSPSMATFHFHPGHRLQRLLDAPRAFAARASFRSPVLCLPPLFVAGASMVAISFDMGRPLMAAEGSENAAIDSSGQTKDSEAVALLKRVVDAYGSAASFSSGGQYEVNMQTAMPVSQSGTFRILFSRPNDIRVDWTDVQFGGMVVNSSVFTRDGATFFYMGILNRYFPEKSIADAIGAAGGVSHGISYAVPSLLSGKLGYLNFTTLKALQDAVINGAKCRVLSGTVSRKGDDTSIEIAIDPVSFLIRRMKTTSMIRPSIMAQDKEFKKVQAQLAKSNPALAAKLPDTSGQPDFTSVTVMTFADPAFGKELKPADFVYPVPATAEKTDSIYQALGGKGAAARP